MDQLGGGYTCSRCGIYHRTTVICLCEDEKNKQTIVKIYTEEQLREAYNMGYNDAVCNHINDCDGYIRELDYLREPIEIIMEERTTAVGWLIKNLPRRFGNALTNECRDEIEKAIQMEKQQIRDAINYALDEDGHTGEWRITFINSYLEKISDAKAKK